MLNVVVTGVRIRERSEDATLLALKGEGEVMTKD
jgi:hypothetical protein